MQPPRIVPYGEEAVLIVFGESFEPQAHLQVTAFSRMLAAEPFPGYVEHVPSYVSVCVYFDPLQIIEEAAGSPVRLPHEAVIARLQAMLARLNGAGEELPPHVSGKQVRIPVCYCPECGPDLPELAASRNMTPEQAAALHSQAKYTVSMIGFLPGFPYMNGLPEALSTPRLSAPRSAVPPGSVGIAGLQTGIYPMSSPGGWRLIGRTGAALFRPDRTPPSLLEVGDEVIFVPLPHHEALSVEVAGRWD